MIDSRAVRLRRGFPALGVFVEARLEQSCRRLRRLDVDHLRHQLKSSRRIDPRERRRRSRFQSERIDAVVRERRFGEERAREGSVVSDPGCGPREAEERSTVLGRRDENVFVCARRPARVPE